MEPGRGLLRVVGNDQLMRVERDEASAREAEKNKDQVLSGLVGYIMPLWEDAKRAKIDVRRRMMESLRQRRGEYDPDKLAKIRETGGSEIYMMVTSVKCRAAASWLRDALLGQGHDKPWTISPTPDPSLPDDALDHLHEAVGREIGQFAAYGVEVPPDVVRERIEQARKVLKTKLREKAREQAEDTERILEDELIEGNFTEAMDEFLDDFVTYPAAILKGPVVHRAPSLTWAKEGTRWVPIVEDRLVKRWYRVDPFKFYPASWSSDIEGGPCFEHHKLTLDELYSLIGAPGYDEAAIRAVISEGSTGLRNWLNLDWFDSADAINQGTAAQIAHEGPLDALEFYGAVPGKYLLEWGVQDPQVNDREKSYNVNLWLIGRHVIKATINPDPLGKKPYRKGCYEAIPGAFWGNSVPDLIRDVQDVCNASARSLVNNMAISSGPQVAINVTRLPPGAQVTQLYPWKVHQFESDPMGSTAPPIEFFQPQSNAAELMGVFNHFSNLADEYSGLPKYMMGDTNVGGAGRTASGLSSLMSNSNRLMKQVMAAIDRITSDVIGCLHQYLMQFEFDRFPELMGDIRIVPRGATSVMAREQLALRRSEFLQATGNPIDMQITGIDGRAYMLREQAKALELDTDRIVGHQPPPPMPPQPGQPGAGDMPGRSGQGGSQPVVKPNQRPIGATMDRPQLA